MSPSFEAKNLFPEPSEYAPMLSHHVQDQKVASLPCWSKATWDWMWTQSEETFTSPQGYIRFGRTASSYLVRLLCIQYTFDLYLNYSELSVVLNSYSLPLPLPTLCRNGSGGVCTLLFQEKKVNRESIKGEQKKRVKLTDYCVFPEKRPWWKQ